MTNSNISVTERDGVTETVIEISAAPKPPKVVFADPLEVDAEHILKYKGLSQYTRRKLSKARSADTTSAEQMYANSSGYGLLNVATPPYNLEELGSFFDTSPTNHAAIVAKVSNVVGLGYGFEATDTALDRLQSAETDDRSRKVMRGIERAKTTLDAWLESLNPYENFQTTLSKIATDYEVFGNAYIEIGRTVDGRIGYLGHIPALTVRVRQKKDGFVQVVANQIVFFKNFGDKTTQSPITGDNRPNEIIHLKKYSPRSTYYGVPDSVACATAIVGDALASQYNVKFFDNSATPRYICTITGGRLSKSAEEKLFTFLQTSLRGNPHRTLLIPLPLDINGNPVTFKMEKVDAELKDGSWETYRERNKQDILTAHGVPITRIGGASNTGVAEGLSADRMFSEQVVAPTQTIFEHAINLVVAEATNVVKFALNQLTLTDELAQSQIDERYARNQVKTINEIRAGIGLPAHPDGDKFFEPNAQTNAEQSAQANNIRARDQERVANNSDSSTTITGRNAKGSGGKE
jgi:PBSX family phage portal protein